MNNWSQLRIEEREGGVFFPVRARPRGGNNVIGDVREGALLVSITAAPEEGKANAAITDLLTKKLGVAKSTVEIRRGAASRDKTIFIAGLSAAELVLRLADSKS